MTDTALIFELTVNVSPGQGEVQKSGSFYDVKGTFVLDDQYSSAVHMHCYSPIDLSILPQPFYLGVSGKFRYIESPDETEACVLHVEASEHPTVKSSGDDQVPPVVVVHGTVSSQSAGNLEIKLDTYFNSREPKVSFKMDAELQERRYKGNFPNVLGQLVLVYGRLTEPRFIEVKDFIKKGKPTNMSGAVKGSSPFLNKNAGPLERPIKAQRKSVFPQTPPKVLNPSPTSSPSSSSQSHSTSSSTSARQQEMIDFTIDDDAGPEYDEDDILPSPTPSPSKKRKSAKSPVSREKSAESDDDVVYVPGEGHVPKSTMKKRNRDPDPYPPVYTSRNTKSKKNK